MAFRSATVAAVTGSSTITCAKPAGVVAGDQLIVGFYPTLTGAGIRISNDVAWFFLPPYLDSLGQQMTIGFRIASASEPANYSFDVQRVSGGLWGPETNDKTIIIAAYDNTVPLCSTTQQNAESAFSNGPGTKTAVHTAVTSGDPVAAMITPVFTRYARANLIGASNTPTPDAAYTQRAFVSMPGNLSRLYLYDELLASVNVPGRTQSVVETGANLFWVGSARVYGGGPSGSPLPIPGIAGGNDAWAWAG